MRFTPDPVSDETRSAINATLKIQFQNDFVGRAYFTADEFREWASEQHRDAESIALFYQFLQAMGYVVRGRSDRIRNTFVRVNKAPAAIECDSIGNCPSIRSGRMTGKILQSYAGLNINGWRG